MARVNFIAAAESVGLSLPESRPDGYGNPPWRWTVPGLHKSLTVSEWNGMVSIVVESHGEVGSALFHVPQALSLILAIVGQGGWQHDNGDRQ